MLNIHCQKYSRSFRVVVYCNAGAIDTFSRSCSRSCTRERKATEFSKIGTIKLEKGVDWNLGTEDSRILRRWKSMQFIAFEAMKAEDKRSWTRILKTVWHIANSCAGFARHSFDSLWIVRKMIFTNSGDAKVNANVILQSAPDYSRVQTADNRSDWRKPRTQQSHILRCCVCAAYNTKRHRDTRRWMHSRLCTVGDAPKASLKFAHSCGHWRDIVEDDLCSE